MMALSAANCLVIVPLMPEGVEHIFLFIEGKHLLKVIVPLMPEGVEHLDIRSELITAGRDCSFDAGRR